MPLQVGLTKESFSTFKALIREISHMNIQVPFKYLTGNKMFPTVGTLVWALLGVVLLMGSGAERFFLVGSLSSFFWNGVLITDRQCVLSGYLLCGISQLIFWLFRVFW